MNRDTAKVPEWAVEPIRGTEACAKILGMSQRKLTDILRDSPHYERRGRAYVFYPEHIAELRKIGCPSRKRKQPTASSTLPAPSADTAFARALALATNNKQRKPARN